MKRIIIISSIVFCISCKNDVKPTIQKEFLKSDWIIADSLYLYVEDSLLMTNLHPYQDFSIYNYTISNDSLTIRPILPSLEKASYFEATFKLLTLNTRSFKAQFVKCSKKYFPIKLNHTLNFIKDSISKNNVKIKNLEFSSSSCFGSCPVIDLKISDDSVIYLRGYAFTKHKGSFYHKLTRHEFERINRKFNKVNLNYFSLDTCPLDAPNYSIYIQTNDLKEYKCLGCFKDTNSFDLIRFAVYLIKLDLLLDYNKSEKENTALQNGFNEDKKRIKE